MRRPMYSPVSVLPFLRLDGTLHGRGIRCSVNFFQLLGSRFPTHTPLLIDDIEEVESMRYLAMMQTNR
jgi:hypothetical protein